MSMLICERGERVGSNPRREKRRKTDHWSREHGSHGQTAVKATLFGYPFWSSPSLFGNIGQDTLPALKWVTAKTGAAAIIVIAEIQETHAFPHEKRYIVLWLVRTWIPWCKKSSKNSKGQDENQTPQSNSPIRMKNNQNLGLSLESGNSSEITHTFMRRAKKRPCETAKSPPNKNPLIWEGKGVYCFLTEEQQSFSPLKSWGNEAA